MTDSHKYPCCLDNNLQHLSLSLQSARPCLLWPSIFPQSKALLSVPKADGSRVLSFHWVVASIFSIVLVVQWQMTLVVQAREKAGIQYPRLYAEKAEQEASLDAMIFNCVQSETWPPFFVVNHSDDSDWTGAHQNTLENVPPMVLSTLVSAIHYPKLAAIGCGIWSFSRVFYTMGYSTGEPNERYPGFISSIYVQLLMSVLAGVVVFDLIRVGGRNV
ncbi:hypothetical protein EDB87DRAFT_864148 [Lactarius vividus]|nr:hypothetical protein EDB87DRAFT_864148 [Lactarius vividus]